MAKKSQLKQAWLTAEAEWLRKGIVIINNVLWRCSVCNISSICVCIRPMNLAWQPTSEILAALPLLTIKVFTKLTLEINWLDTLTRLSFNWLCNARQKLTSYSELPAGTDLFARWWIHLGKQICWVWLCYPRVKAHWGTAGRKENCVFDMWHGC